MQVANAENSKSKKKTMVKFPTKCLLFNLQQNFCKCNTIFVVKIFLKNACQNVIKVCKIFVKKSVLEVLYISSDGFPLC